MAAAGVTAAAVGAAGVSAPVVVVMAGEVGGGVEFARDIGFHRGFDVPDAPRKLYPGFGQRHLGSAADAAADQQFDPLAFSNRASAPCPEPSVDSSASFIRRPDFKDGDSGCGRSAETLLQFTMTAIFILDDSFGVAG